MSAPLLGREQILAVLRGLAEELDRRGDRAEVFLVGGAAMKLLAARDEDVDDILVLYQLCGFHTVDEGLDLVEAAYPGKKIPVRVQYLLEEHLAERPEQ